MVSSRRRPESALPARSALGLMHATGRGLPQDHTEAMRWYRLAAEQGFVLAQAGLGALYFERKDAAPDPLRAYVWLAVARTDRLEACRRPRSNRRVAHTG